HVRHSADRAVRRRQLLRLVPAARAGLRQLARAVLARAHPRLFLAHDAAARGAHHWRVRRSYHADQELVPRGDQQAVRADRQGQGPERAPGTLRPRVPQCHADRDRRFSERLHRHPVHRRHADRDHLLARWPGSARVQRDADPRLPGDVRHLVHGRSARSDHAPDHRSDLRADRSPDRLRNAGGVMATLVDAVPRERERLLGVPLRLNAINRRRLANFRANRRGYVSLHIFVVLFVLSLFAELIANDRPLLIYYDGSYYYPLFQTYPETTFGGFFPTEAVYTDPAVRELIEEKGWAIWPLIPYSYDTIAYDLPGPAPSPPSWDHLLGTDDQARDVLARVIYGFRISVLFGLTLTILSSIVGVMAGAVQGYYGGWVDLLFQRFIEIWSSMPTLFMLIILASVVTPSFWWLLGLLLLFSWTALVGVVRAEFLRARNFDFVRAARALGV